MKNKTVEMMIRTQFSLDKECKVDVVCLGNNSEGLYEFEVSWVNRAGFLSRATINLPHINPIIVLKAGIY